ncbi:hypothetical protein M231_04308 [Tremella mesenterica]|uniref:37S ribosomal protein mrp10, mitochondrial n=1 Tax=Tremella mesenterica TaxID=5217 RepID=A0A4Q1BKV9_TREME|nr:hypothetical protein M231_04308 [Tremella mesenterica]
MVRFKVRETRKLVKPLCGPELSNLLACFASSGTSLRSASMGPCADAAQALYGCMREPRRKGRPPKSSINFLLGKVGR